MRHLTVRNTIVLGASAALVSAAAVLAACSSSSGGGTDTNPGQDGSTGSTSTPQCTNASALKILFTPMYSASDGQHMFQIPAIVDGLDNTTITWTASDPSMVKIERDDTFTAGGAMITVLKSGNVTITANAGGLCGTSPLTVTSAQPSDWDIGNARYNNGVSLHFGPRGGDAGTMDMDGGGPACTNCHGPTATMGILNDVSHTPAQTGGFSDDDLVNIIVNGVVPDGGYFDNSILPYAAWQRFHHWQDIGPDQQKGMIVYLRSLTPAPQAGMANFGGRGGDGGVRHHDGGFGGDGGPPPPPPPMDDASAGD